MIRFACPVCGKVLKAQDEWVGRRVGCPRCSQRVQIPSPTRHHTVLGKALADPSPAPSPVAETAVIAQPPDRISVQCPGCERMIQLQPHQLSMTLECARCGMQFVTGESPSAPSPLQSDPFAFADSALVPVATDVEPVAAAPVVSATADGPQARAGCLPTALAVAALLSVFCFGWRPCWRKARTGTGTPPLTSRTVTRSNRRSGWTTNLAAWG